MCDLTQPSVHSSVMESLRSDNRLLIKGTLSEVIGDKLTTLHIENKRLFQENTELKSRVTKLEQALDESEQYSRRNCARISKVPEKPDEDTDEPVMNIAQTLNIWERSGSVVDCLTRDRGAAGSSLTGVTALWSLSKIHLS